MKTYFHRLKKLIGVTKKLRDTLKIKDILKFVTHFNF